ncbi:unnamed protein product [Cylindrotheca closterium]|uniref:Helicase-associated domain-containing protein n=1 Tax=Cylindrotheca closterium TaxID=2856 RepID=A0AAD2FSF7_9STRA|nr:unnamed protein product [Cylindrotheca closterium]
MADIQQSFIDDSGSRHCHGDSMLQEYLLALLRQPLPSLEFPVPSFEDPFGDPKMEPLPFQKEVSSSDQSETDFEQTVTFKDEPIVDVGSKNGVSQQDDVSSPRQDQHDDDSLTSSCENQGSRRTDEAEKIARFRPYQDKKWKGTFQRLIKFKNEFGHCCVPHSYAENPALARWVKRQRHQYKKFMENDPTSTLTTSRLEKLESVGFVWHSHAAAWLEKLDELKNFKQARGHCNVPSSYPENPALSTWVKCQRRQYKLRVSGLQSTMTMDRFGVLKSMCFVFEPRLTTSKNTKLEMKARAEVKSFDASRELLGLLV